MWLVAVILLLDSWMALGLLWNLTNFFDATESSAIGKTLVIMILISSWLVMVLCVFMFRTLNNGPVEGADAQLIHKKHLGILMIAAFGAVLLCSPYTSLRV